MKKSTVLLLAGLLCGTSVFGQWQVTGGFATVSNNSFLACSGDLLVKGGTMKANGAAAKISCANLQVDAPGTVKGTGIWEAGGNMTILGTIADAGKYQMNGAAPAILTTGSVAIPNLLLNPGAVVQLGSPVTISKKLTFNGVATDVSKLLLGNFDLTYATATAVGTPSSTKFVVTNGTGKFIKQSLGTTAFTFPLGATSTGTWNNLILANTGTADNFAVRVLPDALNGGATGTAISTDAVAASWQVSEGTPGGSVLSVTCRWPLADALPGFTRTSCAVRRWNGTAWDSSPLGAATGAGTATSPYSRVRTGITSDGYFAVMDGAFPFAPPVVLRGGAEGDFSMKLFPNPATERVFVQSDLPGANLLRVFDAAGREILLVKNPGVFSGHFLDVSGLANGLYQLELSNGAGERLVEPFLKAKN